MHELRSEQEPTFQRKKMAADELADFFRSLFHMYSVEHIVFICIGTDRSTGDALGPLVGTSLEQRGFHNVIGSLAHPCDAVNLEQRLLSVSPDHVVVAIDACLGQPAMVGSFLVSKQPIVPAESVGKALPAVGHYSIAAVVNGNGPKPYWILQMTSLYKVMTMAEQLAGAIEAAFHDSQKGN